MNNTAKALLTILAMAAVLVYTIVNYINGKTELIFLAVAMAVLGLPMVSMINLLVQEWKKK